MRKFIRVEPTSSDLVISDNKVENYSSKKVQQNLRKELLRQSQNHCSFCDFIVSDYLLNSAFTPEIEHFKPKGLFLENIDEWTNLFISCGKCNGAKGHRYEDFYKDYKPDLPDYEFNKYFEIDPETFLIHPLRGKTEIEKQNANKVIEWLGLNRYERPNVRKRYVKEIQKGSTDYRIDELHFRFVFEYFDKIINGYFRNIEYVNNFQD